MDLRQGPLLLRRWPVLLVGLVLTAGLCTIALWLVPVRYESSANLLLLPPRAALENPRNPFLALGGLDTVTDVVSRAVMADEVYVQLAGKDTPASYSIAPDRTASGPMILVIAEDISPQASEVLLAKVLDRVPVELLRLQASENVRADAQISSTLLQRTVEPKTVIKPVLRAVIVALAGGIAITLGTAAAVDGVAQARARRRAGRPATAPAAGAGPDPAVQHTVPGGAAAPREVRRHDQAGATEPITGLPAAAPPERPTWRAPAAGGPAPAPLPQRPVRRPPTSPVASPAGSPVAAPVAGPPTPVPTSGRPLGTPVPAGATATFWDSFRPAEPAAAGERPATTGTRENPPVPGA